MADYITFYYKKTGGLVKLPNKKDLQKVLAKLDSSKEEGELVKDALKLLVK